MKIMKKILLTITISLAMLLSQGQNTQIQQMINNVSGNFIWNYIETLSGMERYSPVNNIVATDHLQDFFSQLGFDTVYIHSYNNNWIPNVIAEKRGELYPDSIYILGAHYDTYTQGAPGADDNASGTAGVMETGRVIAEADFSKTIRLVCFSGEELGLYGSAAYAQKCVNNGENIVAMLNMDMISHSQTGSENPEIWVASNSISNWIFDDMKQFLLDYNINATWADGSSSWLAYASDHASFWDENIPAIFLNDCLDMSSPNFNNFIHSSSDILGTSSNNQELAISTTQVATALIAEYAGVIFTSSQSIVLSEGYQFISTRLENENPDMLVVLEDILNDNLDFVRNSDGTVLRKIGPNWVNGIGDWETTEGYLFKMFGAETIEFSGVEIAASTPIDLVYGYQFVSFLPTDPIDALYVFDGILGDNLNYIRNSDGEMLRKIGPNWVNGIGDATPGEGYLIKMFADDQLIYNIPVKSTLSNLTPKVIEHFVFDGGNAADPVYTMYVSGLEIGDEVAVFDGPALVGSTIIRSDNKFENSLPIFSTLTNEKGYFAGNDILVRVWDNEKQKEVVSTYNFESAYYAYTDKVFPSTDGEYSIVNILKGTGGIENIAYENLNVYPNPANDYVNIVSNMEINDVQVLNFLGQVLFDIEVNDTQMKINTSDYQTGVYIFKINTTNSTLIKKVTVK
jgi:hypothetical protein